MSSTLDELLWDLIEQDGAAGTKTNGQVGCDYNDGASLTDYLVAVPCAEAMNHPKVVAVRVMRWGGATAIESQTTVARRYSGHGTWLPPPAVASPAVGEFEETVTADPMALAAMDEAEDRLAAARAAEFDREREDRLYYRD